MFKEPEQNSGNNNTSSATGLIVSEYKDKIAALETANADLERTNEQKQSKIDALEKNCDEFDRVEEELRELLWSASEERKKDQDLIAQLQKKLKETQINRSDEEIRQKEELASLRIQMQRREEEIRELKKDNDAKKRRIQGLLEELRRVTIKQEESKFVCCSKLI
ncbi:unnamed protein product [Gongylonema pulchrum]|uniref:Uncharacterized protein n=1 Tax=Gongylonema pulchrum TaxID=637853 RepID=A0A183EX01_9BILA|nr:unnamed protein product [Gongylonema pulchrum]